ncbi:hypothetical protein C1H46_036755, partial [Malus baccata]
AGGPFYPLYTGKRDITLSFCDLATYELPSPEDNLRQTLASFASFASRAFDEIETVSLFVFILLVLFCTGYDCFVGSVLCFHISALAKFSLLCKTYVCLGNGAHSIGVIHCKFFENHLYNFSGSRKPDPSLDVEFLHLMRSRCNYSHSTPASAKKPPAYGFVSSRRAPFRFHKDLQRSSFEEA